MAQWAHFGRVRAPFHLYVPASAVDIARRLCTENAVTVSELWSYHSLGDQTRFTLIAKNAVSLPPVKDKDAKPQPRAAKPAKPAAKKAKPAAKKAKPAKPTKKPKRK
jgi:cell division septation protein DedD